MRYAPLLVLLVAVAALAGAQAAYPNHGHGHSHGTDGHGGSVVWAQTNEISGNHIVVYDRASDGTLSQAGTYATGGNGGAAAPGTESDHLATQGSLVYDPGHSVLIAVNAGSDTVTTFKVHGDRLQGRKTVSSGGEFPASIAVHGRLVYVLNAGGSGDRAGLLAPRTSSAADRRLGEVAGAREHESAELPELSGPGRLQPERTEAARDDEAERQRHRRLPRPARRDALGDAGRERLCDTGAVRIHVHAAGQARLRRGRSELADDIRAERRRNAERSSLGDRRADRAVLDRPRRRLLLRLEHGQQQRSSFTVGADGTPSLLAGVAGTTNTGNIDLTVSGRYLYVQTGLAGTIDGFHINGDGSLTSIGSVTGLPIGSGGHRVQLKHLARREGPPRRGPPGAGTLRSRWRGSRSTTCSRACVR